ncbi:hypothetical protein PPERSA_07724 [Pseudocohnilembus persalinus]|uniref:Uncharacterized protein n=1 Tax=Pseudocohnilembus persalinus TaxID=266149 RepID=A0A0V0R9M3_PSEPJ|nr:hypothetical protein PPERSA_07724 [Pseudocohnilembus persalinus]|eukprot:KRX11199.1 hypothetical protein PPERSA_07724 [Pseudocohnilembus persalinus]
MSDYKYSDFEDEGPNSVEKEHKQQQLQQNQGNQQKQSEKQEIQQNNQISQKIGQQTMQNQEHRMRISIDIHTIKDQDFKGSIYAKYTSYPELNITHFKTSPVVELHNARVEGQFKNSFKSYTFQADRSKLIELLNKTIMEIEIWHQDRLSSDIMVGVAKVEMSKFLSIPNKKTANSVAKVSDQYLPLDEVDEQRKPVKKIGLLRVISYLEDLGPEEALRKKEQQLGITGKNERKFEGNYNNNTQSEYQNMIPLPSQKQDYSEDPEKQKVLNEMNSLEYKIIWELETWKKAEEAKFQVQLKQRETEYLEELKQQQKEKDFQKQKYFKQAEGAIQLLEKKLKEKSQQLRQREQKLILVEEELRTKIQETARTVSAKDDEIQMIKNRNLSDKSNLEKEKSALQVQLDTANAKFKALQQEFEQFKKEQNNSPITLVKNELSQKVSEIKELQKELQREHEVKEQYKIYYEKIRGELIKQKKIYEEYKENQNFQNNQQIQELKQQIENLSKQQKENINPVYFQQQQQQMQQQYKQQQNFGYSNNNNNNQYFNKNNNNNLQDSQDSQQYPEYNWDKSNLNELDRLIQERDYLLQTGDYLESDPLIVELNNQIQDYQK